jgi:DNA invertase Pin-like site-specific DNA recombinase
MTSEELEALRLQYLAQGGQVTEPAAKPAKGRPIVADEAGAVAVIRRRAAAGEGIATIAKAMRHSTRTINTLANRHGIAFASNSAASTVERNRRLRAALAPKVQRLANRGMIQVEIAAQLRITRAVVRRIAAEYAININSRAR